ncbi:hypothetical protein LTR86_000422 [Recurvomyces mirabilis]|nr:hypothetical protein LTR86_000422 [Recurvomyces mirabilis]
MPSRKEQRSEQRPGVSGFSALNPFLALSLIPFLPLDRDRRGHGNTFRTYDTKIEEVPRERHRKHRHHRSDHSGSGSGSSRSSKSYSDERRYEDRESRSSRGGEKVYVRTNEKERRS